MRRALLTASVLLLAHPALADVCELDNQSPMVAYSSTRLAIQKCKPGDTLSLYPAPPPYETPYLCSMEGQVLRVGDRLVCHFKPSPPPNR